MSLAGRLARWSGFLQQYYFEIQYCKGSQNRLADGLSRQLLLKTELRSTNAVGTVICARKRKSWIHNPLLLLEIEASQRKWNGRTVKTMCSTGIDKMVTHIANNYYWSGSSIQNRIHNPSWAKRRPRYRSNQNTGKRIDSYIMRL